MSFDNGTYVRFKTLNHRISGPQMWAQESSGMYSLSGSEVLDLGILSIGANTSELEIRCRLNGTLAPLNATSELVGKDFSIPYYVFDSDTTLDEDTEFWFYIPPSYDITYDPLNGMGNCTWDHSCLISTLK